ncbi:MAG TPA: glycosyltransferase family 39 protein [Gemmataceae bacterium]
MKGFSLPDTAVSPRPRAAPPRPQLPRGEWGGRAALHLSLLVIFTSTLFFFRLDQRGLWASHEARAAQHAQVMLDGGGWGLPRLYDGTADLQKPPGYYWLAALSAKLLGGPVDAFAVRLPAAAAALLCVLLVYGYLWGRGRPVAGLVAALVLAGTLRFTGMARVARIDMPLTLAITAALLLYARSWRDGCRHRTAWQVLAWLSAAAAVLLKGPVGLALPLAVVGAFTLAERRFFAGPDLRPHHPRPALLLGPLVFAAAALPWFVWANHATGGELFRVFVWHHNVERALGGAEELASYPWWYYGPRFLVDCLPWTPALAVLLAGWLRSGGWRDDADARFGLVWLAVMFGVLSCASFKRADYLLPLYPGAAIFLGCAAERWWRAASALRRRWAARGFAAVLGGCLIGWWGYERYVVPRLDAAHDRLPFARLVRDRAPAPEEVLLFRAESHLFAYYLGRPIHSLVEWAELNERLARPGEHYVVTQAAFVPECLRHVRTRRLEVVAAEADLSPQPPRRPLALLRTRP